VITIKYMNRKGDQPLQMSVEEAIPKLEEEQKKGNLVVDLSDPEQKRLMDKTGITLALKKNESATVGVFRPVQGG